MDILDFCSGIIITLIICFGIFGNIVSFLVWTRGRRCKKLPGVIYMRALAVSDTFALGIPAVNLAVSLLSETNPKEEYNFICKLEIAARHFGLLVSSWIIVCFTMERTLIIFRPTTMDILSKRGTIILMTIIFIVNSILNLPFGVVYGLNKVAIVQESGLNFNMSDTQLNISNTDFSDSLLNMSDTSTTQSVETGTIITGYKNSCSADKANFFHFLNWYHIWFMDIFLIFFIPFGVMTCCNLTVLYLVVSSRKATRQRLDSKIKAVTMRAVSISVVHCITSGAFSMSVLIPGYFDRAYTVKYSLEYHMSRVTLILAYINHAVNFLLYSFSGSEFRRDCAELICRKSSKVHPNGSKINSLKGTIGNTSGKGTCTSRSGSNFHKIGNNSSTGQTNKPAIFAPPGSNPSKQDGSRSGSGLHRTGDDCRGQTNELSISERTDSNALERSD